MSTDQGAGSERERVVHDERTDARERVHVAQEREASRREAMRRDVRQRAAQRQQLAPQKARKPLETGEVPGETPRLDIPGASDDEGTT